MVAGAGSKRVCSDWCDIIATAQRVLYFGMTLVAFVLAPILLIIGGLMVLLAGGSSERVGAGRGLLTRTVIGIAMALGAFLIVTTFLWVIGAKVSPTGAEGVAWPTIVCNVGQPAK
jgi:hypothetical protein